MSKVLLRISAPLDEIDQIRFTSLPRTLARMRRRHQRSKPSILNTRQQSLTLETLLKYDRIEDLVYDVTKRKVNSRSYEGFV
jgi:hypothetical protein